MALDSDDMRAIIVFSSIAVATVIGMLTGSWISNRTAELESCRTDLNKSAALYARCDERSIHFGELTKLHARSIEAINKAVRIWETEANNIGDVTKGLTSKLEVSNAAVKNLISKLQEHPNTAVTEQITKELQKLQTVIKDMDNVPSIQLDKLLNLATNISKSLSPVLNHQQESRAELKEHMNGHIEALKHHNVLQTDGLKISISGFAEIAKEEQVAILKALDRKYQPDYPMLTLIILNIFLMLYYIRRTDGRNVAAQHQHAA